MRNLYRDLGYANKNPGFATVAVLTLALGIGANTAIFSFVNQALLKPLPYASPERLCVLGEFRQQSDVEGMAVSYPDFRDWQQTARSFQSLAG